IAEVVAGRKHVEQGLRAPGMVEGNGPVIRSNYFDLAMLMDYWSPKRLNHHTEAASMLYAARECARVVLGEGLENGFARHRLASGALRAGLEAMGLEMLADFGIEIGTSFGPLAGRIWRIGTMGYVCRKANVMRCLTALEAVLRR